MATSDPLLQTIAILVFPDFQILDATGPLSAFEIANRISGRTPYRLRTVSAGGGSLTSSCGLTVVTVAAADLEIDTIVIAGGEGVRTIASDRDHSDLVRTLADRARRVASVCTGAFLLAGSGLLDGRRVTTHWRHAGTLQCEYSTVRVERDSIFVKDGSIWSSAGVTAGIDLALALIEEDLGADLARAVARELVVYHRRPGGQSQFSALLELEASSDRIANALVYAREHLAAPLNVGVLAEVACLSERQFGRAFRAETGETPAKAIERLRAEAARVRLENGREAVEMIAAAVGFTDPERMRRAFLRIFGQPPQAFRRAAARAKSFGR
ncbi:GlxA family transcriptional regulator [Polymorphobacter megasporae]|nr:GlxA family transcriptional regulator [Polymorphobacter megasporae]